MACVFCGSDQIERVRNVISNGTSQVYDLCLRCKKNANGAGRYLPHGEVGDLNQYRIANDYSKTAPPCEHCGSTEGTEYHHWAPQHIFKDANSWPTGYLCRKCHSQWAVTMIRHILTCKDCRNAIGKQST